MNEFTQYISKMIADTNHSMVHVDQLSRRDLSTILKSEEEQIIMAQSLNPD